MSKSKKKDGKILTMREKSWKTKELKIGAVVVTYNPEEARFEDVMRPIVDQVEEIIIVDNNSANFENIRRMFGSLGNVKLIENGYNYGVAKALNTGIKELMGKMDWILTLDQDAVVRANLKKIVTDVTLSKKYQNVGLIFLNESDGIDSRWKASISGSIVNVDVYRRGLTYREEFLMDSVDRDFYSRMENNGFTSYITEYKAQDHAFGSGSRTKGGRVIRTEPEWRIYLIIRNELTMTLEQKSIYRFLLFCGVPVYWLIRGLESGMEISEIAKVFTLAMRDAVAKRLGVTDNLLKLSGDKFQLDLGK